MMKLLSNNSSSVYLIIVKNTFLLCVFFALRCDVIWATDWFVRPAGGFYGKENGTSYDNAWNGLHRVVWGEGGVQSGDSLFVCGLHVYDAVKRYPIVTQADIPIGASGISENTRIVVRGDWPEDPGIIWGAYRMSYEQWQSEGNNVWSITLPGDSFNDWFFQDVGLNGSFAHIVLDKAESLDEVKNKPGTHYSTDYKSNSRLYVQCSDGKSPAGRIYGNRYGYQFILGNSKYITFKKLTLYSVYRFFNPEERPHHIRLEKCTLSYGEHSLLGLYGHTEGNEVIDCKLDWAMNGIYTIRAPLSDGDQGSNNYVFRANHIRNMGVRPSTWDRDAHGIGIQGGSNGIIEDNIIENCGSGPLLYTFTYQSLINTVVRRNFIYNLHTLGGASGYGISTQCDNNSLSEKSGNLFYNNVIVNAKVGIRMQFEDQQIVVNNITENCEIGLESTRNYNNIGAYLLLKNNIFSNSKTYHIRWASGANDIKLYSNSNCFYPNNKILFNFRGFDMNFDTWKANASKYQTMEFDGNSITDTPVYKNYTGMLNNWNDYLPSADSPVIGKGTSVSSLHSSLSLKYPVFDIGIMMDSPVINSIEPVAESVQ